MRAGTLNRRIGIEKYGLAGDDGFGNPVPIFTPLGSFRAQLVQSNLEEYFRAGGIAETQALVFRIRYVAGLSTIDRVTYDGLYFSIAEVKELGRREGAELRCVSTGEAVP